MDEDLHGDAVPEADEALSRNAVELVGRLAAGPEERVLPSGDVLVTWRLVVDRPPPDRPPAEGVRRTSVDTLDCVAWDERVREVALALTGGDVVAVTGALRRRFWRAGAGAASRCEVETAALRRLRSAPVVEPRPRRTRRAAVPSAGQQPP